MVDKAIAFCFTATVIYRDTFQSFIFNKHKNKNWWFFQIGRIGCFCQTKEICRRAARACTD